MSFYVLNQIKAQPAPLNPVEPEELHFPTRVPAASAPSPATLNSPNLQSFIVKEKGEKKGEEGEEGDMDFTSCNSPERRMDAHGHLDINYALGRQSVFPLVC